MSTAAPTTDPAQAPATGKKKKNNKKKNANKNKDTTVDTGASAESEPKQPDQEDGEEEPETPIKAESTQDAAPTDVTKSDEAPKANGHKDKEADASSLNAADESEPSEAVNALTKERDSLKSEVEKLKKQLENNKNNQGTQSDDVNELRSQLEEATAAKEQAEEEYQGLLERVNHLKTTLGERLKRDRAELEEAKERIEEIESQNEQLLTEARESEEQVAKLRDELSDASREATSLRSRSNLSQQNWGKERDEMARMVATLKEEVETTTNAMGEWEVIAMEERSVKESLAEKVSELEEQVATLRDNYAGAASERDAQSTAVDNLQKALSEIQEARKRELREMVESSEEQVQALKKLVQESDRRAQEAEASKESLNAELERTAPFEKEVKEKNLLIGKLRHEAIVLNDHLTKALRYLKKTKPEDNVDRQIVTNHMLHFLTLDRSDPKRFQILQVMAGYLNWTEEQREQAGLARPGGSGGSSLRLPLSPFNRTPSTPSLNAEFLSDSGGGAAGGGGGGASKESLADLWAGFLERQAQEALSPEPEGSAADGKERKGSTASSVSRPDVKSG